MSYISYNGGLFPEFIYGLLLYFVYNYFKSNVPPPPPIALILKIICVGVVFSSFIYLIASDIYGIHFSKNRNLQRGVPALLLVAAMLFLEKSINTKNIIVKFFILLGDASYVMYLFHYHIIVFISRVVFQRLIGNSADIPVEILKFVFTMATTVIASIFLYKFVDMPMQNKLKKLIKNK
jgi:peptidoglycan/LPS O-acetylase OafA/YrhL